MSIIQQNTSMIKNGNKANTKLQGNNFLEALPTYLRANGKLRKALVDTFRGLSKGLLAAERHKNINES